MKYSSKRKKTKEQKILAEIHRRQQLAAQQEFSYELKNTSGEVIQKKVEANKKNSVITPDKKIPHYDYLIHDFRKTIFVTFIVIIIQLVLHKFLV